jgi:plastocyanin
VTCTFTNEQDAIIIVEKQTDPDGSTQLFTFSTDYSADFQLSDGQTNNSGDLDPGTYSVSETVPTGWELKTATCDDGSDPSSIDLDAGETVTCTFTNEQDAIIIVEKQTDPDGSTQLFTFSTDYSADFQLSDGQTNNSGDLDPGTYSVSETVPAGWELESATCDDGSDPSSIGLAAGETVTCTFTNEQDAIIIVEKQTDPDGSGQLFTFSTSYSADFWQRPLVDWPRSGRDGDMHFHQRAGRVHHR